MAAGMAAPRRPPSAPSPRATSARLHRPSPRASPRGGSASARATLGLSDKSQSVSRTLRVREDLRALLYDVQATRAAEEKRRADDEREALAKALDRARERSSACSGAPAAADAQEGGGGASAAAAPNPMARNIVPTYAARGAPTHRPAPSPAPAAQSHTIVPMANPRVLASGGSSSSFTPRQHPAAVMSSPRYRPPPPAPPPAPAVSRASSPAPHSQRTVSFNPEVSTYQVPNLVDSRDDWLAAAPTGAEIYQQRASTSARGTSNLHSSSVRGGGGVGGRGGVRRPRDATIMAAEKMLYRQAPARPLVQLSLVAGQVVPMTARPPRVGWR